MKNILLPTDFSDYAWNAIFTAMKLFSGEECHFILLHSYEPLLQNISGTKSSTRTGIAQDSLKEHAQKELKNMLKYLGDKHPNPKHSFETKAIQDDLISAVKRIILERDLEMVVMGTKGATGAKKVFLGSNTVRVIKGISNCPVLAVPLDYNFQALNTIVFATEYAHFTPKNRLTLFLALVKKWGSRVLVFHVAQEFKLNESQKLHKQIIKERLKDVDYSFHEVTIKSTVTKAILDFAQEKEADMLALVHHKHTFMEKFTQEPIVKKVGFKAAVPLLVLPE